MDGGPVVQVGADIELLDTQFSVPVAHQAGQASAAETPGGGLGVGALADKHLGILGNIIVKIGAEFHVETDRFVAPDMLGAPVPSFPAIRITDLLGVTTEELHQVGGTAMSGINYFALPVPFCLETDAFRAIFFDNPLDFTDHHIQSLIPGDSHILAIAAVLGVPFSFGIPVHPLEGIENAVGRMNPFLVGDAMRRNRGLERRHEGLAARFILPRIKLFRLIFPVIV